jgi:hypothetical protein
MYFAVPLLFIGCASYKQLQPKPVLSSAESGYIELKNGKKDFELKKDKKYFINFPSAQEDNFYLVLNIPSKKQFTSFLTNQLTKKSYGEKIADESQSDTQSVYPIPKNSTGYFLIMEGIAQDFVLNIDYRYTPKWRFKFETKHAGFKEILQKNRVDRSTYNSIGSGNHLQGTNFPSVIAKVKGHSEEIEKVYKELLAIESIFPAGIVNSKDEAYENYKKLKSDIEDEMKFQDNYLMVLNFFGKEFASKGNPAQLLNSVEDFISFFESNDRFPSTIVSEAQTVIGERLQEIVPFYNQRLSAKENATPFDEDTYLTKPLFRIGTLYNVAGLPTSAEYTLLAKFVKDFGTSSNAIVAANDSLAAIRAFIAKEKQMPGDDFFRNVVQRTVSIQNSLPKPLDQSYGMYLQYRCTADLNEKIKAVTDTVNNALSKFKEAETLVIQLNVLKAQNEYSTMLSMLIKNTHLDFLLEKYRALDKMSIEEQGKKIEAALNSQNWPLSEKLLYKLHEDMNFLKPGDILAMKAALVEELEDSLYTKIDQVSRVRINKFLEENINTLENIDSLYSDSVFVPVYDVKFSSGSKKELLQRKADLIEHLQKMRDNEFPAKAISLLYGQFIANPNDNGVFKARAIVAHGKYYKGDDNKIKTRIAECDPMSSKWIVKPADYRRIFALPVTSKKRGVNKYVVRLNVDIPTEAEFPVYDVNIKLPKEIAENAATQQWYEAISLNKKLLKNEGRFSITAPSASNDYECQITPVQMNKGKANMLEITFNHPSFKVHPVSIMVQKPLIKK